MLFSAVHAVTHAEHPVQRARTTVIAQLALGHAAHVVRIGRSPCSCPVLSADVGDPSSPSVDQRDGRPKSRQERVTRVARERLFRFGRRLVQVRGVDRLRNSAPVLARRPFGARQRAVVARLETETLRCRRDRGRRRAPFVASGEQIFKRVDADVACVAAVAPPRRCASRFQLEQIHLGGSQVRSLSERNADRVLVNSHIRECWCLDRPVRRLDP